MLKMKEKIQINNDNYNDKNNYDEGLKYTNKKQKR